MASSASVVSPAPNVTVSAKIWRQKLTQVTVNAFQELSKSSVLRDKWFTSSAILNLITKRYSFDDIGGLTEKQLNKALDQAYPNMESSDVRINDTGVFRVTHYVVPSQAEDDQPVNMKFYYITDSGKGMPQCPPNHAKLQWTLLYIRAKENGDLRVANANRAAKRRKKWDAIDSQIFDYKVKYFTDKELPADDNTNTTDSVNRPLDELPENEPLYFDYWESTEAKKLFLRPEDYGEPNPVLDVLDSRIELWVMQLILQMATKHYCLEKEIRATSIQSTKNFKLFERERHCDLPTCMHRNGWAMV